MYVKDRELTLTWRFPLGGISPSSVDFDLVVQRPDGSQPTLTDSVYFDNPVNLQASQYSLAKYKFTPDQAGVWTVKLAVGVPGFHIVVKKVNITVYSFDTEVYQQVSLGTPDSNLDYLTPGLIDLG